MSDLIDRQAAIKTPLSASFENHDEIKSYSKDTISRQAAIDICANAIDIWHGQLGEGALIAVRDKIKELPPAQPEPISDVYMKAVWTWLLDYQIKAAELKGRYTPYEVLSWVANDWRKEHDMPPVTPKQRTGHWQITDAYPHNVYCSECHKRFAQTHWAVWEDGSLPRNFCPNCGAKMNQSGETCDCYRGGRCVGTKEIDQCSCGGNKSKCDFYENVRQEGDAE